MGFTAAEEKHLVDYVTHHANYDESDLDGGPASTAARKAEILARFCYAGKPMPVMIEEYSFCSADSRKAAEGQAAILRGTVGHASGWTTWYLQYPSNPNEADAKEKTHESSWLKPDLTPTVWGRLAPRIYDELCHTDLSRRKPKTTLRLDRRKELVPKHPGVMLETLSNYDRTPQPTDYIVTHEPDLDLRIDR
jgi:hypothetical protein